MSQANIEAIRTVYEGWGAGDFRAGTELFDSEIELVMRSEFPDSGTYSGFEGVARYTRGFLDPWERITIEAEELVEAGDCVVAAVFQQGVGKGSRITTEFRYFHLWRLHDGRIVGLETFRDRDAALEAARASA